jgi:protein-tyrosine phosphatase
MTKPRKLALGIGSAGGVCALLAALAPSPWSWLAGWTALSCLLAAGIYLGNLPGLLGKSDGRMSWWRMLPLLPYLVAFRIAMELRRSRQAGPDWHEVVPGLAVGARVPLGDLPEGLELVVDLTSEWPAPAALRGLPGYRSHPVLDGSFPPSEERFLALVREMAGAAGGVYIHCEEGRGRAPTAAAAVLLARRIVVDVDAALELVSKARPVARPTRTDRRFLERIAPRLLSGGSGAEATRPEAGPRGPARGGSGFFR